MISLVKAQVWKYKSIEDSTSVTISEAVTVLVGKNESGKTAFLEALLKALPLQGEKFDYIADYPRKEFVRYRPKHVDGDFQKVVELTFAIHNSLIQKINDEVFNGEKVIIEGSTFTRNISYGNISTIGFHIDQLLSLNVLKKSLDGLEFVDEVFADAETLDDVVTKIESKDLTPDSKLALFASRWRQTAMTNVHWGLVDGHIWKKYLSPGLPKFLYFDDYKLLEGKINLQAL